MAIAESYLAEAAASYLAEAAASYLAEAAASYLVEAVTVPSFMGLVVASWRVDQLQRMADQAIGRLRSFVGY